MDQSSIIKKNLNAAISLKQDVLNDSDIISEINNITQKIIACYQSGHKVLFCGNGGSAADAQHLAAELSGRYYYDRPPLSSEALHVNTSYLTAVANDYSYELIYARLLQAIGNKGDILIALSTSGNSSNVIKAIEQARKNEMTIVSMTGATGGKMKDISDYTICIPSSDTPRIQECHMLIGHTICEIVESSLFPQS